MSLAFTYEVVQLNSDPVTMENSSTTAPPPSTVTAAEAEALIPRFQFERVLNQGPSFYPSLAQNPNVICSLVSNYTLVSVVLKPAVQIKAAAASLS